jgi:phage N-6-adenine-methyltransferase
MPVTQTPLPLSDEWATPSDLFTVLDAEFHFTLDACAKPWNAQCAEFFTPTNDGLEQPWSGRVWLNPPYSDIGAWLLQARHAIASYRAEVVVALVPCTPDRKWWSEHVEGKAEVRLLTRRTLRTGRVHFIREDGTSGRAPFASAVLVYRRPR